MKCLHNWWVIKCAFRNVAFLKVKAFVCNYLARMTILSRSIWILKDGWWIVISTMLPPFAISFTLSTTLYALVESRPEVGSSRNSRDGLWIMSVPIDTLRRSPPETPRIPSSPMYVWAVVCYFDIQSLIKIVNDILKWNYRETNEITLLSYYWSDLDR